MDEEQSAVEAQETSETAEPNQQPDTFVDEMVDEQETDQAERNTDR